MKSFLKRLKTFLVVVGMLAASILPLGAGARSPGDDASTVQRKDGFRPSRDGFSFRNTFKGSPLPAMVRNAQSGPLKMFKDRVGGGLPTEFGLCGGMSLAAADFYLCKALPKERATPPATGSTLYEYLYQRQTDSMGTLGVMAVKFWKWMNLPELADTGEGTAQLSAAEFKGVLKRLQRRELVPIGLVYTSASEGGRLWENHQVLGYGVVEKRKGVYDVQLYDPNFPRDDRCVLRVTELPDEVPAAVRAVRINGKGGVKKVRGFFAMPYQPRIPEKGLRSGKTP